MSKRNSIIAIMLAVILIVGGLLYFYFRSASTSLTPTQNTSVIDTTNPFGNNNVTDTNNGANNLPANNQPQTTIKSTARLVQLYKNPTSGAVFFSNKNTRNVLRFVDRANSNIYEYIPESQSGQATRITNTTIPKIQESVWSSTGSNVYLRYLDDVGNIASFSGVINVAASTSGALGSITGAFLTSNMKQLVINPKGDKAFGLSNKSTGSGTTGITFSLDGTSKKQVFDSPISLWNLSWPTTNIVTFTTKPTYKDYGYLFFFNIQTQAMDRILGDVLGLSTVTNSDASLVAYSASDSGSFNLDVYDIKSKVSKGYKISTLADKCVWGNTNAKILYCAVPQIIPEDLYPDTWYQGLESFSDSIWMIDTTSGATKLLYQIGSNENVAIDAVDLEMSTDDIYITFSNKNDLSLWILNTGN